MAIEDYTVEYLESLFDYNPDTGVIIRKEVDESYGSNWKYYNTRYANTILTSDRVKIRGDSVKVARLAFKLAFKTNPVHRVYFRDSDNTNHKLENFTTIIKEKVVTSQSVNAIDAEWKNLVKYDHKTGICTWLHREDKGFNTRFADTVAGTLTLRGYIRIKSSALAVIAAHRLAWYLYYDTDPGIYIIDHIDRNKTNNQIKNLRLADSNINANNSNKEVKGYYKDHNKYRASITIFSNRINLGSYDTKQEALDAYETAVSQYRLEYTPTKQEQEIQDELYNTYPKCSKQIQHAAHAIQIKSLKFKQALAQQLIKNPP